MGCADSLWRDFTSISICDLAADDSAFCCCNALDNSGALQCSNSISHNVLLPKRLGSLLGYFLNQTSVFLWKYHNKDTEQNINTPFEIVIFSPFRHSM